ncbi:MAG: radical SAM protein [Sedimentisphaerales bacterium]|jgi:radical SAM superfamily enzyme YgiQ (UPF0313 family)
MLTLVNTNRMVPPIGPIGLDYVAASIERAGIEVEPLDLGLAEDPAEAICEYFSTRNPELVGLSFRNADDCFWPSADWFVPGLKDTIEAIRKVSDAPIILGGVGYSIFPKPILEYTNAEFGICGDGEAALPALVQQLRGARRFSEVPGLLWRQDDEIHSNPPSWPEPLSLGVTRNFIDNRTYFERGGQCGLETQRGCNRDCMYCADPLAKGSRLRLRKPTEVADEVESLLAQAVDVLHICDCEFNVSRTHAIAVCEELERRHLGDKVHWYTYMTPTPFDAELAEAMARAGCAGIDFTGDSACESMLRTYRQRHNPEDLATAVKLCRRNGIAVMIDLLLGGPGETPQTLRETINFIKKIDPDSAGAALGMRIYPRTAMEQFVSDQLSRGDTGSIRRKYSGPIDPLKPTFYISAALGERPAELVRDLIAGDKRFFEPAVETPRQADDEGDTANYNYNENELLSNAIRKGARGAYWHILQQLRHGHRFPH